MWEKRNTSVKYSLIAVNFTFLITGIITLSVGYSVHSAYNAYHTFLSDRFFAIPNFCVVTGVIIFLMACFGFCGVYSQNYNVIRAFTWAIGLTSVAQLSLSIAGFMLQSQAVWLVQAQMEPTRELYNDYHGYTNTKQWDQVQERFSCCGVNGASDWIVPLNMAETYNVVMPMSCCPRIYGSIGTFHCNLQSAYVANCAQELGNWAASQMAVMGLIGTVLALTQALLSIIAFWLVRQPKTDTAVI